MKKRTRKNTVDFPYLDIAMPQDLQRICRRRTQCVMQSVYDAGMDVPYTNGRYEGAHRDPPPGRSPIFIAGAANPDADYTDPEDGTVRILRMFYLAGFYEARCKRLEQQLARLQSKHDKLKKTIRTK